MNVQETRDKWGVDAIVIDADHLDHANTKALHYYLFGQVSSAAAAAAFLRILLLQL